MKKFSLLSLKINNFKGIKEFVLPANGKDLMVLGGNGTGKTTLFDGFTWLLFGRDSMNRTKFEIKTLDEEGNVEQHGASHSVEGIFDIDGKKMVFKRVFKEEWTKHRGSLDKTFTGNTTDYFMDDVPVIKKEYDQEVSSIVSDDIFKLLTSPTYFNEHLDHNQRRKILLDMIDDVNDLDVANHSKNEDLISLVNRLDGKDVEKHQEAIKSKQGNINKEMDRIPIRIDEINLSLPDTTGLKKSELNKEVEKINKDIEEKQSIINNIKSGGQISEYQKQLSNIDMEITKIRNNHDHETNENLYRMKASLQEKESNVTLLDSKRKSEEEMIKYNNKHIKELNDRVGILRKEWVELDETNFEHKDDCECPTCGQDLPEEEVNEARKKAEGQFNENKANGLESIIHEAEKVKERVEKAEKDNVKIGNSIEKHDKEIKTNLLSIEKIKKEVEELEKNKSDITENAEYNSKLKEKESIEQQINDTRASANDSIEPIAVEIEQLESSKKDIQSDLNKFDLSKQQEDRLKELEEQEKTLAKEYAKLAKDLFLTEEFTKSRVELLEGRINEQFKYAKFKLFEEQVNGGLREVCETQYDGVPYNRGLNNASRINIGLDIINTLSRRYGIQVPIFVDNKESVTDLLEIESQTIGLIVDRDSKKLVVEQTEDVAI